MKNSTQIEKITNFIHIKGIAVAYKFEELLLFLHGEPQSL
jgi:hypothetical protein